ncbi:hypothetical protein ACIGXM_14630 [Kitasatospora sp. NPDC052896]|uniref:hypothetical protein n=1 Tax=Kitasatospora sp. NPDC052896 TaxID=3364061 RepID=UPI0037CAD5CA
MAPQQNIERRSEMTLISLPGLFCAYWNGSSDAEADPASQDIAFRDFRAAYDTATFDTSGGCLLDLTAPAMQYLRDMADGFAGACGGGSDHTDAEARASATLMKNLANVREDIKRLRSDEALDLADAAGRIDYYGRATSGKKPTPKGRPARVELCARGVVKWFDLNNPAGRPMDTTRTGSPVFVAAYELETVKKETS